MQGRGMGWFTNKGSDSDAKEGKKRILCKKNEHRTRRGFKGNSVTILSIKAMCLMNGRGGKRGTRGVSMLSTIHGQGGKDPPPLAVTEMTLVKRRGGEGH